MRSYIMVIVAILGCSEPRYGIVSAASKAQAPFVYRLDRETGEVCLFTVVKIVGSGEDEFRRIGCAPE